jgi:excisionase family DNA binding protein
LERETGFEPATLSLGSDEGTVAAVGKPSQVVAVCRLLPEVSIQAVSPEAAVRQGFASSSLPDVVPSLTVKAVAVRLRVCTATIYRFCAAGQLRHFHVGAAIRIREADLRDWVASGGFRIR